MKFSPRTTAIFGLWTTILMAVAAGGIHLPLGISDYWVSVIKSWCLFFGAINGIILTGGAAFSSVGAGPLAPFPTRDEVRKLADDAQMMVVPKQPAAPSVGVKQ